MLPPTYHLTTSTALHINAVPANAIALLAYPFEQCAGKRRTIGKDPKNWQTTADGITADRLIFAGRGGVNKLPPNVQAL